MSWIQTFIGAVAATVCKSGRLTNAEHSSAFGVSFDTIHKTLYENFGLSKKSAR